jgi:general secretion pathway protein L
VGEERSLLTARSQALDKAIGRMPTMRQVLRELTIIVPDDTWLSEFTCQDNRVTIRGFSGNSSVLLGALEASPLFRQVRFGAPITQDARVQREVFLIQSELEETP